MNAKNQAASAVSYLTPEESAYWRESGAAMFTASRSMAAATVVFGDHLKACDTLEAWTEARSLFVASAIAAGAAESYAAKLFENCANSAGLSAPKSVKPDAVRKAKERELPAGSAQSWLAKAAEAAKAGDTAKASEAAKNAERIAKAAEVAARKVSAEAIATQRKRVSESVAELAKAGNVQALRKLADYAAGLLPQAVTSTLPPKGKRQTVKPSKAATAAAA
jgi:vacuolar-type H+-ATPase subunit H